MKPIGLTIAGAALLAVTVIPGWAKTPAVDFDRDIRPILSENCFTCHGFDDSRRQAGLRLDLRESACKPAGSGKTPIVAGKPELSELIRRVTAAGSMRMPPVSVGKSLTPGQIDLLRRWIAAGAKYEKHWSFIAPQRPPLPPVKNTKWVRNPIDRFILARLESERLQPGPEADRRTLLRRVTLDLTGLPPTLKELNSFLADKRPDAYERVVDRLLASRHYGERMALNWLDMARYADTHGYHMDSGREMWRWRDWVINAFNRNMPFDQFTIKQIAGDLLPHATLEDRIASGFNRNHPITIEGGAIPEEYAAAYIFDRIDTTTTTWLGLTVKCAQCHDHKYDPITQKEFYQIYAFFNNVPEQGLDGRYGNAVPFIKAPTRPEQWEMQAADQEIAALQDALNVRENVTAPAVQRWEETAAPRAAKFPLPAQNLIVHYPLDEGSGAEIRGMQARGGPGLTGASTSASIVGHADWQPGHFGKAPAFDGTTYASLGDIAPLDRGDHFSYGAWVYPTSTAAMAIVSRMDDAADFRGWDLFLNEGKVYVHMIHKWETNAIRVNSRVAIPTGQWSHVFVTYDGSSKASGLHLYINGKLVDVDITHDTLSDTIRTEKPAHLGRRNPGSLFQGRIQDLRIYARELSAAEVGRLAGSDPIPDLLAIPAEKRSPDQKTALARYYLQQNDTVYPELEAQLAAWQKKRADVEAAAPSTMVMEEMDKPRDTFVLIRGAYDHKGERVEPGTPAIFPPLPAGAPRNRLGLAEWLVSPTNPLTARVTVNHFWQMYFGTGLVKTAENFGTQGERPSHPELLDWLATEFMRTGWNMKAMQRLIVTSAAYRQSSHVTPALVARDPENRLIARGPRIRLPAETIRDQALALSGLLVDRIGGPSVKPYQPPGLWKEISSGAPGFTEQEYVQDHGEALYRRSMYTFWKRTCPPPSLQTLDAPDRDVCVVQRSTTDTPLQALVLMNDPTFVEASRKLAARILHEAPATTAGRIQWVMKLVLDRPPRPEESRVLLKLYQDEYLSFKSRPGAAEKLLSVGESPNDKRLDANTLAAWTTITSVILNLDETITKS